MEAAADLADVEVAVADSSGDEVVAAALIPISCTLTQGTQLRSNKGAIITYCTVKIT